MTDGPPKSAFEIAMERLRKKDADEGVQIVPLSDAPRAARAEVRNFYEARLAQEDVLHQSSMRTTVDPAERDVLQQQYRRERERLISERDAKLERIRRGEAIPNS
jgi:hypothetical protein